MAREAKEKVREIKQGVMEQMGEQKQIEIIALVIGRRDKERSTGTVQQLELRVEGEDKPTFWDCKGPEVAEAKAGSWYRFKAATRKMDQAKGMFRDVFEIIERIERGEAPEKPIDNEFQLNNRAAIEKAVNLRMVMANAIPHMAGYATEVRHFDQMFEFLQQLRDPHSLLAEATYYAEFNSTRKNTAPPMAPRILVKGVVKDGPTSETKPTSVPTPIRPMKIEHEGKFNAAIWREFHMRPEQAMEEIPGVSEKLNQKDYDGALEAVRQHKAAPRKA